MTIGKSYVVMDLLCIFYDPASEDLWTCNIYSQLNKEYTTALYSSYLDYMHNNL